MAHERSYSVGLKSVSKFEHNVKRLFEAVEMMHKSYNAQRVTLLLHLSCSLVVAQPTLYQSGHILRCVKPTFCSPSSR